MAKIFLNPDNLKVEIDAIRTLAALCSTARTNIDNESAAEHDPYEGIEDFLSESSSKIETVNERADSIESAMNTIIELSENGVAPMDVDGTITVTAPDAVVAGGMTEFDAWAQGAIDAAELTSRPGSGPRPSGRTRDEIIASIEANQNSTPYSLAFIDTAGPANLTQIPLMFAPSTRSTSPHDYTDAQSEQAYDLAGLLGQVLANASRSWDDEKAQAVADEIVGSVDESSEYRLIPVLNEILGFNEVDLSSGTPVGDPTFGTSFLVALGQELETIDQNSLTVYVALQEFDERYSYQNSNSNPYSYSSQRPRFAHLPDGCFNIYQGLVEAMADNPEAGTLWLAPDGLESDAAAVARIRTITGTETLGDNEWTDAVADLAHAMSTFGTIDMATATTDEVSRANRTALATAGMLNEIGESGATLSTAALADIGEVLAVYAPGVDRSIQGAGGVSGSTVPTYVETPDSFGEFWGDVPAQALFSNYTLSSLIGQIGQDEHGLDPLTAQMALINDARFDAATNAYQNNGNNGDLTTAISAYQRTQGFITGAIAQEALDQGAEADARVSAWVDGIMGLTSFIPGVDDIGHVGSATVSYSQARAEAGVTSTLKDALAHHTDDATVAGATLKGDAKNNADRAVILALIHSGVITPEQIAQWAPKGSAYSLFNDDGSLKYELLNSTDQKEQEEVAGAFAYMASSFPGTADPAIRDSYENGTDNAFQIGLAAAGNNVVMPDKSDPAVEAPNKFEDQG